MPVRTQVQLGQSAIPRAKENLTSVNVGLITTNVINQLKEELL